MSITSPVKSNFEKMMDLDEQLKSIWSRDLEAIARIRQSPLFDSLAGDDYVLLSTLMRERESQAQQQIAAADERIAHGRQLMEVHNASH